MKGTKSKTSKFILIFATIVCGWFLLITLYLYHSGNNSVDAAWKYLRRNELLIVPVSSQTLAPAAAPVKAGKKKIAYAITVTKDGPFLDGALVLGYSAQKVHSEKFGYISEYEPELIAFVTVEVVTARPILQKFGWKILEKPLPVELDEIQNKEYAEKMRNSGCCGASEFLKLWAYTLTEYHRVVHLDMDSIVFKNMDEIYNMDYELLFTGDHNMRAGSPVPPVQGGFLVIRPSVERFKEFQDIIRIGDYEGGGLGWGKSHIGSFWGGQTIQGILPYFYHSIHPGDSLELNRCIYNCMVDNPYNQKTMKCLDRKDTCEDCRTQVLENVSSAHYTICQKPWTCTQHVNPRNKRLCTALHQKWFTLRDEFEHLIFSGAANVADILSYRQVNSKNSVALGMCRGWGDHAYSVIPIDSI